MFSVFGSHITIWTAKSIGYYRKKDENQYETYGFVGTIKRNQSRVCLFRNHIAATEAFVLAPLARAHERDDTENKVKKWYDDTIKNLK